MCDGSLTPAIDGSQYAELYERQFLSGQREPAGLALAQAET